MKNEMLMSSCKLSYTSELVVVSFFPHCMNMKIHFNRPINIRIQINTRSMKRCRSVFKWNLNSLSVYTSASQKTQHLQIFKNKKKKATSTKNQKCSVPSLKTFKTFNIDIVCWDSICTQGAKIHMFWLYVNRCNNYC